MCGNNFDARYDAYMSRTKDARPRFTMSGTGMDKFDTVRPAYNGMNIIDPYGQERHLAAARDGSFGLRFFKDGYGSREMSFGEVQLYMGVVTHDERAEQFRQLHQDCVEAGSLLLDLRQQRDPISDQMTARIAGPLLERWQALTMTDRNDSPRMAIETLGMLSTESMHDLVSYMQVGADAHAAAESGLAGKPDPACEHKCNAFVNMAREGAYRFMNAYSGPANAGLQGDMLAGVSEVGDNIAANIMCGNDGRVRPEIRFSDFDFALPRADMKGAEMVSRFDVTYLDTMGPGVEVFDKNILSAEYRQRVVAEKTSKIAGGVQVPDVSLDVIPNNLYYSMTGKTKDMARQDMSGMSRYEHEIPPRAYGSGIQAMGAAGVGRSGTQSAESSAQGDGPMFDHDFTGSVRQAAAPMFDRDFTGSAKQSGAPMFDRDFAGSAVPRRSTRDLDAAFQGLDSGPEGPEHEDGYGV